MRIGKIDKVFHFPNLGKIASKYTKKDPWLKVKVHEVVDALHANQKEEGVLLFFIKCISDFGERRYEKRLEQLAEGAFYSYKILKSVNADLEVLKEELQPIRNKAKKYDELYQKIVGVEKKDIIEEKVVEIPRKEIEDAEKWFAKQHLPLSKINKLAQNGSRIRRVYQKTRKHIEEYNKKNRLASVEGTGKFGHKSLYGEPFDHNRLGKIGEVEITYSDGKVEVKSKFHPGFEDFYISGSKIEMPYGTYDIMQAPLVPDQGKVDTVSDFWDTVVVMRKSPIIVTVHDPQEKIPEIGFTQRAEYWTHDRFETPMSLRGGWELARVGEDEVIATSRYYDDVRLVKRTFRAKNVHTHEEHKVSQFHYQGWPDHCGAPDIELLEKLHQEVDREIAERGLTFDSPITVHCAAGLGRSPTFAISHLLRREILERVKSGEHIDEIAINFPKTVYRFNNQRPSQLSNIDQYQSVLLSLRRVYLQHKGVSNDEIRPVEAQYEQQIFTKANEKLKEAIKRREANSRSKVP